jgi:ATP-binding protein involved in chromosome partitioning
MPGMTDLAALVRTALATVQDPDLHKDLVTLNMIRDLVVADGVARFRLVLTTGACPVKKELEDRCRAAATSVAGVSSADITVEAEVPKGAGGGDLLPGVRQVIGVGSGKGGVGKSTVAVNLACALAASGARVGLLDADIHGPSIPTMMGVCKEPFVSNKKLIPLEAHGVKLISMGFLVPPDQAVIWRGPMVVGALRQFLSDVVWGELDYLVVDLPPGTGDVQLSLAQNAKLAGAVVVTTPQTVALDDARRSVAMFQKVDIPILGIVENMSQFVCPSCGHIEPIFDVGGGERYAKELGLPFLGSVPLEPSIRKAGDGGKPVVLAAPTSHSAAAFHHIASQVAAELSKATLNAPATTPAPVP